MRAIIAEKEPGEQPDQLQREEDHDVVESMLDDTLEVQGACGSSEPVDEELRDETITMDASDVQVCKTSCPPC